MILLKHSNYSHPPLKSSWIILGPQYILLTTTMNSQFDCTLSLPNDRGPTATREEITKNPECLVLEFRNFVTSPPAISTTVQFILLCAIEPPLTPTHINSHLPPSLRRWLTFTENNIFSLFTSARHCCWCSCYSPAFIYRTFFHLPFPGDDVVGLIPNCSAVEEIPPSASWYTYPKLLR